MLMEPGEWDLLLDAARALLGASGGGSVRVDFVPGVGLTVTGLGGAGRRRGGGLPSPRLFYLIEDGDPMICQGWDTAADAHDGVDVEVYKNPQLLEMQGYTLTPPEGGDDLEFAAGDQSHTRKVIKDPGGSNEAEQEQLIVPRYWGADAGAGFRGQTIIAVWCRDYDGQSYKWVEWSPRWWAEVAS